MVNNWFTIIETKENLLIISVALTLLFRAGRYKENIGVFYHRNIK